MNTSNIDDLLENLIIHTANEYGGFEGFDDEDSRDGFNVAKQAIQQELLKAREEAWVSLNQGATCCKDKHQTFFGAVVTSPQWELWREKQSKNPTRDMAEVEGLGVMSTDHFQEFMQFCTLQLQDFYVPGREIGFYKIVERTKVKSHKNRKYKVACLDCGKELLRYSNKFRVRHKGCIADLQAKLKGDDK